MVLQNCSTFSGLLSDMMSSEDFNSESSQAPDKYEIEILESQQSMNENISIAVQNETSSLAGELKKNG